MDPVYGYEAVNVEAQWRAPSSLLHWTRRMLEVRKGFAAFGRGTLTFLRPVNRKILAYLREYDDEIILCVANLGRTAQPVELDLAKHKGRVPLELLGRTPFPPIGDLPYMLTLAGHAFLWFRLASPAQVPGHEEQVPYQELPVLLLFDGWASLFRDRVVQWRIGMSEKVRHQLEVEALPAYVAGRRWYAAKSRAIRRVELADSVEWKPGARTWLLSIVRVETEGEAQPYFLPLSLAWEDYDDSLVRALSSFAVAKVRQQAQVGVLADAFGDESFVRAFVEAVGAGAVQKTTRGRIEFRPTSAFADLAGRDVARLEVSTPVAVSSNTVVALGDRLFVKAYRRLSVGVNPEVEIGRYLTEVARFAHAVPVAGSVDYVADDGRTATLGLVQGYVANQGDGWDYTRNYLERFFDDVSREAPQAADGDVHGGYVTLARTLGVRTAQLHAAFAQSRGNPGFDPEPATPGDVAGWTERVREEASAALGRVERIKGRRDESTAAAASRLLAERGGLLERIARHGYDRSEGAKTRVHGDYHLGQVLLVQNDFVITDFEGEPARPLAERARKASPLKDVAGMLRSFDYAMHAALFTLRTERSEVRERVETAARQWRTQATRAFVDGYDEVARANGLASPRAEANGLLELFMLEKALYELGYEADNRPEWLVIPLTGLLGILDGS
jgi:maltose alpha-D-glucosyltransferase/alpha-amylase